jgi:hypothetical protein
MIFSCGLPDFFFQIHIVIERLNWKSIWLRTTDLGKGFSGLLPFNQSGTTIIGG